MGSNRFYRCFLLFALYFVISLICFTVRPSPPVRLREEMTTTQSYTTTDMTWPSSPFSSTEMPLSSTTNWPTENDTIDSTAYDDLNSTVTEPMTTTRIETTIPITSPSPRPTKISMASSVSPRDRHRYNVEDACILQHVRTNYITPLIWWMVLIHSVFFPPEKVRFYDTRLC